MAKAKVGDWFTGFSLKSIVAWYLQMQMLQRNAFSRALLVAFFEFDYCHLVIFLISYKLWQWLIPVYVYYR